MLPHVVVIKRATPQPPNDPAKLHGAQAWRATTSAWDEVSASPSAAQLLHSGEACAVYRPAAWAASAASAAFFFATAASCSASGILGGEGGLGGSGGGDGGDGGVGNGGGVGGEGGVGAAEGGGVEGGDIKRHLVQPAPYDASQASGKPGLPCSGEQREVAPSLLAQTPEVYFAASPAAELGKPR